MLVIMKKSAGEVELDNVKQTLIDLDFDFHQSTGMDRIIIGVIGHTKEFDPQRLKDLPGVLEVFKIPDDD